MGPFYSEAKKSRNIRYLGVLASLLTLVAGIVLERSDFIGAVGAVGLAALVPYAYFEKKNVEDKRSAMRAFYGSSYHEAKRMKPSEYEKLSKEDKHQYNELSSDIGTREIEFDEDVSLVERRELLLAVLLTLLWAFGAAIYDLINFGLCSAGATEC
ncbi:MAG: hypothetical protein NXH83_09595 [Rhodobacteraceae bacterium]|nr:hypothetical protein [Paracoccaceae bacterium]